LGETSSFKDRVATAEEFLLARVTRISIGDRISAAVAYLFRQHGAVRISTLSDQVNLGLRQFERLFRNEVGVSPKMFARVARFQAALDAKLACPQRTWLEIAHSFGYYDQMHMVHDFETLGQNAPTHLIAQMGDVRPPALTSANVGRAEYRLHEQQGLPVKLRLTPTSAGVDRGRIAGRSGGSGR